MADIEQEIVALRNFVADLGFGRIWLNNLPEVYTASELSIRYEGDDVTSETAYHYRAERRYQFIYFGSQRECVAKVTALQRRIRSKFKIEVEGSSYLTLGPFSFSQPFKTEGSDNLYGIIGVLQANIREARSFEPVDKMGGITVEVSRKSPSESIEDGYEIIEGACK